MSGRSTTDILDAIVAAVPVPGGAPTVVIADDRA